MIEGVVAPVDHTLPVSDDDVRRMEAPAQIAFGPVIVGMTAAGLAETTFAADVDWHPLAPVTVTV